MKLVYLVLIGIFCMVILFTLFQPTHPEGFETGGTEDLDEYIQRFNDSKHRMFPFRYFTDENDRVFPVVAVTGFFREKEAEDRYREYVAKGVKIIGITAYKTFPNRKLMDKSEGEYERNDTFNYTENIRDWLCCLKNPENYGFTSQNRWIDISESDFYTSEYDGNARSKKYDFLYICCKDSDTCPLNGWNAVNRNFDLALKCFPILCNEFNMKGLVVGRTGCGLEEKYGDKLEVVEWFDWHILQEKMHESRMLLVPNIYDASPRVVAECLTKDVPVIMNENIICGSKYINYETGELFKDENTLRSAVTSLLNRRYKISPKKWWGENYSQESSQKKLRDFLFETYPDIFLGIERVKFIL